VPHEQDRSISLVELALNDAGGVCGLQTARHRKDCLGVARAPEQLGCLPCPKLAAVPDDVRPDASARSRDGHVLGRDPTWPGQRLHRLDLAPERMAVVNQHDRARLALLRLFQRIGR